MPEYNSKLVSDVAENAYELDVNDANKMELLGAVFEMAEVPFDEEELQSRDWVKPDDLRAIIYALALKEYTYTHPDDIQGIEEWRDRTAPTGDE
jgi:hypothetical protein